MEEIDMLEEVINQLIRNSFDNNEVILVVRVRKKYDKVVHIFGDAEDDLISRSSL
jgi:hypothetical protein